MRKSVTVTLGEIAEFVRGITFKPEDVVPVETENSVVCLRTKNVQTELDLSDVWAVDESLVRRLDRFLKAGDILISSANSWNLVGKCSWIPELPWKASFGGFVTVLRADPEKVYPRFLFWWFSSERIQALARSFGNKTTNISNLNIDRCLSLSLELPCLDKQKQIAGILDQVEFLRVSRREAMDGLDELVSAVFIDMFESNSDSDIIELGELLDFVTSGGRGWAKFYSKEGSRFIRSIDVQMNYVGEDDVVFVTPPQNAEARRTVVQIDDVLLTITGSKIGRVAPALSKHHGAFVSQHVAILRFDKSKIEPAFLSYYLSLAHGGQRQIEKSQYGQTKPGLNFEQIRGFKIPKSPIELQQKFCQKIASIEAVKNIQRTHLIHLNALFSSLQQRAFRGEL